MISIIYNLLLDLLEIQSTYFIAVILFIQFGAKFGNPSTHLPQNCMSQWPCLFENILNREARFQENTLALKLLLIRSVVVLEVF